MHYRTTEGERSKDTVILEAEDVNMSKEGKEQAILYIEGEQSREKHSR